MKVFCDTNVAIAAFLKTHAHPQAARPVIERVKKGNDEGFFATHSLAECYSVMTRLPGADHVPAGIAWDLIHDNLIKHFTLVAPTSADYSNALSTAGANSIEGGRIYDALLLAAAEKSGAVRVYTFNVSHFQSIAGENLRRRIMAP